MEIYPYLYICGFELFHEKLLSSVILGFITLEVFNILCRRGVGVIVIVSMDIHMINI